MRKFKSPMVSRENFELFVAGEGFRDQNKEALALVDRVLRGKKPFAQVTMTSKSKAQQLYKKLRKCTDVAVSPMEHWDAGTPIHPHRYQFLISRLGTLSDNFDLKALAAYYRQEELPEVARDIPKKAHYTLPSYFSDWDYDAADAHRDPPVEPWETGLILGYDIDSTIHVIYYGEGRPLD